MLEKNVHAIILARGGSKGIKNKNLIPVKKKPLIYWSIKSALNCKTINKVWVSSDSNKILRLSKKLGANIIKRPKNLASDNSSSESGWLHSIKYIKKFQINYIVAMQATSPLRGREDLTNALKKFFIEKNDSLFSCSINEAFFRWKVNGKKIKPNYKLDAKRPRRQSISKELVENGSFYIFSCDKFLKKKKDYLEKLAILNKKIFWL